MANTAVDLQNVYDDVEMLKMQMAEVIGDIIALQNTVDSIGVVVLTAGTNLNTLGVGCYLVSTAEISATLLNKPDTTSQTAFIEVVSGGADGQLVMNYLPCSKNFNRTYTRAFYNNAWGEWNVTDQTDSGWVNLTLNTGWSMNDYEAEKPQYRKIGKVVYLRGLVNATAEAGVDIATLPAGCAPNGWFNRWVCSVANSDTAVVQINSNGVIKDHVKTTSQSRMFLSLNGISFMTN